MAKKKELETPTIRQEEFIQVSNIENVMSEGFGRYSKYVLQERAVPDVRDGLKPVQRRILYTMILEGNVSTKPTRKCARTVGAVIGRFHPHGDTSVYEAMVRLSQDWKMRYPLIDFQGNNGSIDGDGPAAYRYTEARLSELSDYMVQDLNKNTVDMQLNFDDQEFEPVVLPSRFPNMLVNGTQGIAIGASTDIPPHNLVEVIDAINYRISHKNCKTSDLMEFIKGPDFPTGGIIKDVKLLQPMYETGTGSFKLWCKTEINTSLKDINQIIITEIPFGRDKSELVNNIDKCRFQNSLNAIIETRDETDRDGLRIVIDLYKDADPNNILNFLLSKGVLCTTIKFNTLVIDHNRPKVASLLEMIDCYIEHQVDVVTRRLTYDLNKAETRLHIVDGLVKATSIIDDIVHTIRKSKDKHDSKINIMNLFGFTEIQAEAIVNLQLYRLSNIDIVQLENEQKELNELIANLKSILESPTKLNNLIKSDLNNVKAKYGDPRRTLIEEQVTTFEIDKLALIAKEDCYVSFTRDGYIKKSNVKSYKSSADSFPGIKLGDVFKGILKAVSTDNLLLFTNLGNYISVPVYKLQDKKWKDEGNHINDLTTLAPEEKIVAGIHVESFIKGASVVILTKKGQIKKTPLYQFEVSNTKKTYKCFKLMSDDEVISASLVTGQSGILILASNGSSTYFDESEVKGVGIKAGGIKGIKFDKDCYSTAGLLTFDKDEKSKILVITDKLGGRIVSSNNLNKTARLGSKQNIFKTFKSEPHNAVFISKLDKDYESKSVNLLFENYELVSYPLKDVISMSLDNYIKANLNIKSHFDIVDAYTLIVPSIGPKTKIYEPLIKEEVEDIIEEDKEEITKKEDNEQLSLFDFVDDD